MNEAERKAKLEQNLQKAMAINNIAKSSDYINYLRPYLKELATVQPIDPALVESDGTLYFKLKNANMRATVYRELLTFLDQQEEMIKKIGLEINNPKKSYGI